MSKYITKQRKILQEYLSNQIDQELSAKKIAKDLKEAGMDISLSAIYRNLAELEKEKMVVACPKEGTREFFFRYVDDGCFDCFHFSCRVCNAVSHMPIEDSKILKEELKEKFQFFLESKNTVFYGVCAECGKNEVE